MKDKTLAVEAVSMVAEYLSGLKLTPYRFSAQVALCQLLELADEDPASDVAHCVDKLVFSFKALPERSSCAFACKLRPGSSRRRITGSLFLNL